MIIFSEFQDFADHYKLKLRNLNNLEKGGIKIESIENRHQNVSICLFPCPSNPANIVMERMRFCIVDSECEKVHASLIVNKLMENSGARFRIRNLYEKKQLHYPDGKFHFLIEIFYSYKQIDRLDETPPEKKQKTVNDLFNSMIGNNQHAEVILKTFDGLELKANIEKLSKNSSVFKKMFGEQTSKRVIDIEDFDNEIMTEVLRFIYYGEVQNLEVLSRKLLKAAYKYEIHGLLKICLESVYGNLHGGNVIEIVTIADLYDITELFEACCQQIRM